MQLLYIRATHWLMHVLLQATLLRQGAGLDSRKKRTPLHKQHPLLDQLYASPFVPPP